ncbi:hypothetical protein OG304_09005 [Streptomyces sp. NBC_00160]|uniref:hypothetical protein n=1 Tax=Streptomyces sp. NBC_00160 TaxID=2903628 RepID=UPI00224E5E18|nr:hypothetical protein [Streptomyces sp. NBC_00160]MCX5303583.1 hypothetical protein [Streptomyces sp. NBC_00160]
MFVLSGPGGPGSSGGPAGHTRHRSSYGAVGLDLDLLAGPEAVLPFLRGHVREDDWYPDDMVEAGVLADEARRLLLLFASEGPIASLRTRAATLELLRCAWPGWEVRWLHDGQTGLRTHLGLDPGERDTDVYPGPALDRDDEELADPDPLVAVVTIGQDRCHVLADIDDHPAEEGPALLERLRDAPEHGSHRLRADAGIHVDPERRRVGWWLNTARAHAGALAGRWPGWTVEFWEDRWAEHERASGGRFAPPAPDRAAALADVRDRALERWAGPRGDVRARLVAALPHATIGRGFGPAVPAEQAAAARAAVRRAYAAAVGT